MTIPVVKPHAEYSIIMLKACCLRPAFAESYLMFRVNHAKERLFVFDMQLIKAVDAIFLQFR